MPLDKVNYQIQKKLVIVVVFLKTQLFQLKSLLNLEQNFPEAPSYKISETAIKVPAGWLIEKAGLKESVLKIMVFIINKRWF